MSHQHIYIPRHQSQLPTPTPPLARTPHPNCQVLTDVSELLDCAPASSVIWVGRLMQHTPDVAMADIKRLVLCRADLSRSERDEALEVRTSCCFCD